jgi:hypothetical protein
VQPAWQEREQQVQQQEVLPVLVAVERLALQQQAVVQQLAVVQREQEGLQQARELLAKV